MDVTTFSRQSKMLESKGLISRRVSSDDRRVSLLSLTPEGELVLSKIDLYMTKQLESIFSFMTPFERDSVVRALRLFNQTLTTSGQPGKLHPASNILPTEVP